MFYKHSGKILTLIIYADDVILISDDNIELEWLKKKLADDFEIKNLDALKHFLGMEVGKYKKDIFFTQCKYVLYLLDATKLLRCKATETPIQANLKIQPAKIEEVVNQEQYQKLVGKLIYLTHTCPDLAFAKKHGQPVRAFTNILKSITRGRGLLFKKHEHLHIKVYTDANAD